MGLEMILQKYESEIVADRLQSVLHLAKTRDKEAIVHLKRIIDTDPSSEVRYYAKKALNLLSQALGVKEEQPAAAEEELSDSWSVAKIRDSLKSKDQINKKNALVACYKNGITEAVPVLLDCLAEEPDPQIRAATVTVLGKIGDGNVITRLVKHLEDPNFRVRANTVEALEAIGNESAYPYIIRMLQDEDNRTRANAVKALRNFGSANTMKTLEAMIRSGQPWQQGSAVYAMSFFPCSEKISELLNIALQASDPSVREKARSLNKKFEIKKGDHEPAVQEIIDNLKSRDNELRLSAAKLSSNFLLAEIEDALKDAIAVEKDSKIKSIMIRSLGNIGTKSSVGFIGAAAADADPRVRANAIEALISIGDISIYPYIVPCLKDSNNRVKANAVIALSEYPVDTLTPLKSLITSKDPMMRRSALYCISVTEKEEYIALLEHTVSDPDSRIHKDTLSRLRMLQQKGSKAAGEILKRHEKKIVKNIDHASETALLEKECEAWRRAEEIRSADGITYENLREVSYSNIDKNIRHYRKNVFSQELYTSRESEKTLDEFSAGAKKALLLTGTAGTGKTCLLCYFSCLRESAGDLVFYFPAENIGAEDIGSALLKGLSINFSTDLPAAFIALNKTMPAEKKLFLIFDGIEKNVNFYGLLKGLNDLVDRSGSYPWLKIIASCDSTLYKLLADESPALQFKSRNFHCREIEALNGAIEETCESEVAGFKQLEMRKYCENFSICASSVNHYSGLKPRMKAFLQKPLMLNMALASYRDESIPIMVNARSLFRKYLNFGDQTEDGTRRKNFITGIAEYFFDKNVMSASKSELASFAELKEHFSNPVSYYHYLNAGVLNYHDGKISFSNAKTLEYLISLILRETLKDGDGNFHLDREVILNILNDSRNYNPLFGAVEFLITYELEEKASFDLFLDIINNLENLRLFNLALNIFTDLAMTQSPVFNDVFVAVVAGCQKSGFSLLVELAHRLYLEGRTDRSLEIARKMIEISAREKDRPTEQVLHYLVSTINRSLGASQQSIMDSYEKCIALSKLDKCPVDLSVIYERIGVVHFDRSNYEKAVECFNSALSIKKNSQSKAGVPALLIQIGKLYQRTRDFDKAVGVLREAAGVAGELSRPDSLCLALYQLGSVLEDKTEYDQALTQFEKSLAAAKSCGNWKQTILTYNHIGMIFKVKKSLDKAIEYFKMAVAVAEKNNDRELAFTSKYNIGMIYKIKGDLDEASKYFVRDKGR